MDKVAAHGPDKVFSWRSRWSQICVQINWEEQLALGARQTSKSRVPVWGNKASKPQTKKPMGVAAAGETPSLTGEFVGETHRVLEHI